MKHLKRVLAIFMVLCLTIALIPTTYATIYYETVTDSGVDGYPSDDILALFQKKSITQSGMSITLNYRLYVPADYDPNIDYPVVLFLHGYGERGSGNDVQLGCGMMKAFFSKGYYQEHPCIIVAPQCPDTTQWAVQGYTGSYTISDTPSTNTFTEAIQLCKAAVDQTIADYSVDTDRLYVTGLSMGGYGTWNIITHYPDYFAAAMPICGGGDPSKADRLVDLPIWAFHGDADPTVPVSGTRDMYNAITAAGGTNIQYTEWMGADHFTWTPTYVRSDVWNWMFNQSKSGETVSTDDLAFRTAALKAKDQSPLSDTDKATVNSAISYAESVINGTDHTKVTVTAAETRISSARALFSSEISASSTVIDSGVETEDRFVADNISDGDTSSAWQALTGKGTYGSNVWVGYDAGKLTTFDGVEIRWESGTRPADDQYAIQVSSDGVTWTTVSNRNQTVKDDVDYIINFSNICGRYIRVFCTGGSNSKYFPKIYEMKIYGKTTSTTGKSQIADLAARSRLLHEADTSNLPDSEKNAVTSAINTATPLLSNQTAATDVLSAANAQAQSAVDVVWKNVALESGVTTLATDFAYTDHTPSNINDGDTGAGWQIYDGVNQVSVSYNPSVWVGYDFGEAVSFRAVELWWESGSRPLGKQYTLQVSSDGTTWTDIADATYIGHDGTVDAVVFGEVTSRYLRVNITGGTNGKYYPKLYEFAVYTVREDINYADYVTIYGDVDNNGYISATDMTLVARHLGGITLLTDPVALANASADKTGVILASDLTAIARISARLDG